MRALVALGSNLGDRRAHLEAGLAALASLGAVTPSPLWTETPDESGRGPDYLNTVALVDTALDPPALLEALLRAELRLGRDRVQAGRNIPRTLDLDLILAGDARGTWRWPAPPDLAALGPELALVLPHPRAAGRPFVVEPARALGIGPEALSSASPRPPSR
ncbi:2-amino-4-hydroxy-6-hydroxymethyldihydropteridine diphosphokinase [Mesoterricola sediminis]|uniref:2-amino-4-hydroxy-6-hydroxymethyldihydropteridine pyrophosphokinase n=1 Tax=Mesoterricola sediminis TaxID=2927980 RepID=A0AA48GLR7_9BACT|nr:2-amino-4-hydroxy-6-hydroxymethyldihydropteridine diphosphokinase [Mesoterricola sediminis]BDU75416.1 2-amino-4-hydroxy-6-hydroxymethyldihydropteridine pyrophosphokinase [Mesoterricola sediminis]